MARYSECFIWIKIISRKHESVKRGIIRAWLTRPGINEYSAQLTSLLKKSNWHEINPMTKERVDGLIGYQLDWDGNDSFHFIFFFHRLEFRRRFDCQSRNIQIELRGWFGRWKIRVTKSCGGMLCAAVLWHSLRRRSTSYRYIETWLSSSEFVDAHLPDYWVKRLGFCPSRPNCSVLASTSHVLSKSALLMIFTWLIDWSCGKITWFSSFNVAVAVAAFKFCSRRYLASDRVVGFRLLILTEYLAVCFLIIGNDRLRVCRRVGILLFWLSVSLSKKYSSTVVGGRLCLSDQEVQSFLPVLNLLCPRLEACRVFSRV